MLEVKCSAAETVKIIQTCFIFHTNNNTLQKNLQKTLTYYVTKHIVHLMEINMQRGDKLKEKTTLSVFIVSDKCTQQL